MPASPLSVFRFRLLFFTSWFLWALLQAWVMNSYGLAWNAALIDSFISNIILMAASLLLLTMLRFYLPGKNSLINPLVWIFVLSLVWLAGIRLSLPFILQWIDGYDLFMKQSVFLRIGIAILLLGWIAMTGMLWYSREDQKESEKRKQDASRLAKEAELFKLRQQLQPHFLFNSLNSINALIGSQPAQARKMIQQLSDFLRGSLKKDDQQFITLQEELNYLDLYLQIEKVRFGHRLSTNILVDEELLTTAKIPAFLLQPVVENAIKFGLYDTTEEITINIHATQQEADLVIEVQNPFDASTASAQAGTGFGLSSVSKRLNILFARSNLLVTQHNESIFTTKIIVPQS